MTLPPAHGSKVFETLEAFNQGYAGPQTKLLEKKSRGKWFFARVLPGFFLLTDAYVKILLVGRMTFVSSVVSAPKNCFRKQVLGRCTCVLDSSVIVAGISRRAGNEIRQLSDVV